MVNKHVFLSTLFLLLSLLFLEIFNSTKRKHPYAGLNIEQLVRKYGYQLETHEVVTDDGYILTLHRIPQTQKKNPGKGIPVLLMHGFMQSATDFVNLGPKKALSFLLNDKGYDVWLGNARGTTWSRKHKVLNPNTDKSFWDFSLHEIGVYDVPAIIDHILKTTNQDSLHYVGYSQGTSIFFIMGSEKPQYLEKITLMSALAPSIFVQNPTGLVLGGLIDVRKILEMYFDTFNVKHVISEDGFISSYMKQICNENSIFVDLCLHHIFLLHGYSYDEVNKTELSLIFSNTPAGASSKQLVHILQLMESGKFHQYDLGVDKNLKKYGQPKPPCYVLSKISTPVALYYSSNDWTINIENIDKIVQVLPNVVKSYKVPSETFNHNDFINAKNVAKLLYDTVIEEIVKYSN